MIKEHFRRVEELLKVYYMGGSLPILWKNMFQMGRNRLVIECEVINVYIFPLVVNYLKEFYLIYNGNSCGTTMKKNYVYETT